MVAKEYVEFFQKSYPHGRLLLDGLTPDQQDRVRGKASTYLSRTKDQLIEDMDDLMTLASLLPEKHLIEVFTLERIDRLVSALLTVSTADLRPRIEDGKFMDPKKMIEESSKDLQRLVERQNQIAAMIMEKGADKCLEAFEQDEKESPLYRSVQSQALTVISLLSYVATRPHDRTK